LLVAGAHILLQGLGQGLVADFSPIPTGEFRGIGHHKRERVVPVEPVFRQVKANSSGLMPTGGVFFQERTEATVLADLRTYPLVEP